MNGTGGDIGEFGRGVYGFDHWMNIIVCCVVFEQITSSSPDCGRFYLISINLLRGDACSPAGSTYIKISLIILRSGLEKI